VDIIAWVLLGIAVVNFLGAAAVYLRGSRDKGTIETLTRSNVALQENNVILNERVGLLEVQGASDAAKILAQGQSIEVLTNVANSGDKIDALQTDLDDHHVAAMAGMTGINTTLQDLPRKLAAVIAEAIQEAR
jgi:hypothetical protein